MPEKTGKGKEKEKKSLNKKLLAISVAIAAVILVGVIAYQFLWRASEGEVKFSLKAAIIDQLSEDFRNQTFVNSVTTILEEYNFTVTYYDYTKTTFNFFRGLAKGDYGIIILRLHSALRKDGSAVDFFTSEPYDYYSYPKEQDEGLLVKGELNYSGTVKEYFAFTPKFVEKLEGTFPKSIIIAMGCQTLNKTVKQQMAEAFRVKGAKAYIGWSSWVSVSHSDDETTKLMERLLHENKTIEEAVKSAEQDQVFGARLGFYPESAKDLRISDLIKESQTSLNTSLNVALLKNPYMAEIMSVKRFNSLATVVYSWFRRLSPARFALFSFFTSSANCASSKTSFIHFSKSPRYR